MNMKKVALATVLISVFAMASSAFAVESLTASSDQATSGAIKNERLEVKSRSEAVKNTALERRESKREEVVLRVRNSVGVHVKVLDRAIGLAAKILDKLQLRIDRAKEAGKDVTSITALMTDARSKLADATTRLGTITTKKDQAVDKATFRSMELELKTIRKDIQVVKQDASKIIRQLKEFNSSTSSAKNASSSAEKE